MSHFINLLDIIYPVNSLYFSFSEISPSELIGGTWVKITGKYLRLDNNINAGGSDTHSHALNNGYAQMTIYQSESRINYKTTPSWTSNWWSIGTNYNYGADRFTNNEGVYLAGNSNNTTIYPSYQNIHCWRRTA